MRLDFVHSLMTAHCFHKEDSDVGIGYTERRRVDPAEVDRMLYHVESGEGCMRACCVD